MKGLPAFDAARRGITVEYALTRRSALGAAGAGAVLFTVASCSNERSDYAGEVKLEKYDKFCR